ncbi:MAG: nucleotidyltransferase/DNA polymerase protein [Candidatus Kaiserbacteria bacterium]|nr:nucleotidyltransferase/DNA polymerase protein [Candidatus Kaiserbacteria bacterium]
MHVDGDSFFASCEVAKDPSLRGRAVITGKERGIVSSMTYEARALGIRRAMPLHEIAKKWPEVVILPSDYETYSLFSHRMYAIVRRYTPMVEEYSIDECFADLTGLRRTLRMPYPEMAAKIKEDLQRELGMTFSMGLSATKTLAKIGSKWKKPAGLTVIPLNQVRSYLENTLVGSVWGIGPNTAAYLQKFGIQTAFDFASRDEEWVRSKMSKPGIELWQELGGTVMNELDGVGRETYQSISKTKTFTPPSRDKKFVFSELSKNIENACIKARRWGLASDKIVFFLKTQQFAYHTVELKLSHPTCVPQDVLRIVSEHFPRAFKHGTEYRATGVTLLDLKDADTVQLDLFGAVIQSQALVEVFKSVDAMCEKYGKHSVFLASSLQALDRTVGEHERGGRSTTTPAHFRGESSRRRLGMAFLGEVN